MAGTDALMPPAAAPGAAPAAATPTPAAAPAGATSTPAPATPGQTGTPAANETYYKDWPAELHDVGKKYATPVELAKAYHNAEKLIGGDPKTIMRMPAEGDAEAQGALWNKLGRPATAEGYKLPDSVAKDETLKSMLGGMHALGLTQAQVEGLSKISEAKAGELAKASNDAFQAQVARSAAELRAEWGGGFDRQIQAANAVIDKLGLTADELTALAKIPGATSKSVIQRLAAAGAGLVESKSVAGGAAPGTGFGNLTPAEAKQQWTALTKDPAFVARMRRNDPVALQQKRELDAAIRGVDPSEFAKVLQ